MNSERPKRSGAGIRRTLSQDFVWPDEFGKWKKDKHTIVGKEPSPSKVETEKNEVNDKPESVVSKKSKSKGSLRTVKVSRINIARKRIELETEMKKLELEKAFRLLELEEELEQEEDISEKRDLGEEVSRRTKEVLDEGDRQMKSLISVHQDDDNDRTESFKLLVDEQKLQVKMDLKTITNEQGFDLLKYDIKSSGDHAVEPTNFMEHSSKSTDVIIDKISRRSEEQEISSKELSDNTTEYEVVNLGHVDLFQEFKTTISEMRNVLNTMEVNKPDNSGSNKYQQKMNEILKQEQQPENILTQTATTTINQICATTDSSSCNQTRNESVMVQLSSETTTKYNSPLKRITHDSNLFNYMKLYKKIRRRKKQGCRCRRNKLMKKAAKTKMKPKCSVSI